MRFLFDCEDEVCLPAAYRLVDEVKPFIDKVKDIELTEEDAKAGIAAHMDSYETEKGFDAMKSGNSGKVILDWTTKKEG